MTKGLLKREDLCTGNCNKPHMFEWVGWGYGKKRFYRCIACDLIKEGRGNGV